MKLQVTGGAVVSLVGLVAVGVGVLYARNALGKVLSAPIDAVKAINNATPPGITVTRPDGTMATVTGQQIKEANANGSNYGIGGGVATWGMNGNRISNDYDLDAYDPKDPFAAPKPFDLDYNFGVINPDAGWDD